MLHGKYPLLIALFLGLMAGLIAYSAIKSREVAVRQGWETKQILCAAGDVAEGTELEEDLVGVCEIPERFVTDSFIVIPEGEGAVSAVMPYGQKLLVPLKARDPILYSHFESQRAINLSESIPMNARAIAINVSEKSAVSRWIRPNDHVDVLGTIRDPNTREQVTITLLQNMIVLATGGYSGMSVVQKEEDKRYNNIVLLMLPAEAELLTLAAASGELNLTLRNPKALDSDEGERRQKTDSTTLMSGERSEALRQARVRSFQQVEIIRGGTRTE